MQELAEFGDYEGFNAIVGAPIKENEFDAIEIDIINRDAEFRNRVTDICREAWARKHPRRK